MGKVSNYLVIYGPRVSTHGNPMQERFAVQSSSVRITHFRELYQGRASLCKTPSTVPGTQCGRTHNYQLLLIPLQSHTKCEDDLGYKITPIKGQLFV